MDSIVYLVPFPHILVCILVQLWFGYKQVQVSFCEHPVIGIADIYIHIYRQIITYRNYVEDCAILKNYMQFLGGVAQDRHMAGSELPAGELLRTACTSL